MSTDDEIYMILNGRDIEILVRDVHKHFFSHALGFPPSYFNSDFSNKSILSLRKRIIRVIKSMIRKKSKRRVEYT